MVGSDVCIGNIEVLLLSNNYIRNVHGLDRLYSLERLSLDNNLLANLSDISKLAKLPNLEQLSLRGNPIVFQGKISRDSSPTNKHTCNLLSNAEFLMKKITKARRKNIEYKF